MAQNSWFYSRSRHSFSFILLPRNEQTQNRERVSCPVGTWKSSNTKQSWTPQRCLHWCTCRTTTTWNDPYSDVTTYNQTQASSVACFVSFSITIQQPDRKDRGKTLATVLQVFALIKAWDREQYVETISSQSAISIVIRCGPLRWKHVNQSTCNLVPLLLSI